MTIITFDSEQLTSCPMNETATKEECLGCKYCKAYGLDSNQCLSDLVCVYTDVFPELKDFAGLKDCVYMEEERRYPIKTEIAMIEQEQRLRDKGWS